jgi:methionyl-tRNA synthetase
MIGAELQRLVIVCLFAPLMLSLRTLPVGFRHAHRCKVVPKRSLLASLRLPTAHLYSRPNFQKESAEKYFEFSRLEPEIYDWWEKNGMFLPDSKVGTAGTSDEKPFVVPMPPPNVTGYLHMGHAIFVALQDIMARFQRMRGRPTLWLPGT